MRAYTGEPNEVLAMETSYPHARPRSLLECDGPYALSRMPLQARALTSARCHLERDHGLDPLDFPEGPDSLLRLHFLAHGFDPVPRYPASCLPWQIRSLPHSLLEERGEASVHR